MHRLTLVLVALLGIVSGAVGSAYYYYRTPPRTDAVAVRAIVAAMIKTEAVTTAKAPVEPTTSKASAPIDQAALDPMIEKYLVTNPQILQTMSAALDQQTRAAQFTRNRAAIAANQTAIFNDPDRIVLGNPKGDVTLVEMFDYNCSYCRKALPDLATLMTEDPNLRVILKEFPILTPGSVDAARVAVQVAKSGADYWTFHKALFSSRGEVTGATALSEAKALGLDPDKLKAGMQSPAVSAELQKSFKLAQSLGVSGTPTYIIGDAMIPGAVPIAQLRTAISNMRTCGSAQCPPPESTTPLS